MNYRHLFLSAATLLYLSGCGTFTGLPGHGGGKRFAIEQELISASSRAVAKDLQLDELAGKSCALFVNIIGDEGAGNFTGGRYNWESNLRGEYISTPATQTSNKFPIIDTTTTSTTGSTQTVTETEEVLNYPSKSRRTSDGATKRYGTGMRQSWPPSYRTEAFINPNDSLFLKAIMHEIFCLRGIPVVPPQQADVNVYVTVDVFGTVRQRTDWQVYNVERLAARTSLQISAFSRDGRLVLGPQVSSHSAEYIEKYILWMGPVSTSKRLREDAAPMVDFCDIAGPARTDGANHLASPPTDGEGGETLTKPRTAPIPAPEGFRPEDVKKHRE